MTCISAALKNSGGPKRSRLHSVELLISPLGAYEKKLAFINTAVFERKGIVGKTVPAWSAFFLVSAPNVVQSCRARHIQLLAIGFDDDIPVVSIIKDYDGCFRDEVADVSPIDPFFDLDFQRFFADRAQKFTGYGF